MSAFHQLQTLRTLKKFPQFIEVTNEQGVSPIVEVGLVATTGVQRLAPKTMETDYFIIGWLAAMSDPSINKFTA